MSLSVRLKQFHVARSKGAKLAKLTFRDVTHTSRVLEERGELIIVDERFDWQVSHPLQSQEQLQIELFIRNRYLSDKFVGSYCLILQTLIHEGKSSIADTLLDANNKPIAATVTFEVTYTAMEGSDWSLNAEQQMLVDIEQNIANIERSMTRRGSWNSHEPSPEQSPSKVGTLKSSVKALMRLGRHKKSRRLLAQTSTDAGGGNCSEQYEPLIHREHRSSSMSSLSSNESAMSNNTQTIPTKKIVKHDNALNAWQSVLKSQDFQVCITIIEARQLAGLNMDPVVCVQVGDTKKYTSVKESTNCPYYNEYFVFDFHMPAVMLFDKIITLSVMQSRNILRTDKMLGSFKLDVATVWQQTEHQFFHKWALLTDPDDIAGGPKGYLKCDISVIGKGDTVRIPSKSEKDDDNIEANLLLPDGVPIERQRARYIIRIYRADGLPKMNSSIIANVKKAFMGESKDLVDPYVQVSFAGLTGKTSVKKCSYAPVWNEQIVFTEMFPPLCQRIKIQIRDSDPVSSVIATHFIDLKNISNDGDKGFLPTLGPTFMHMYGSTRDYSIIDQHSGLNTGLGEGVSYRARLLIAIRTEISDAVDISTSQVFVEPISPISETMYGKVEEYFLFATILEASMIDKKLGEKPMFFELSIGNAGNTIDGHNQTSQESPESDSEDNLESVKTDIINWASTTPKTKPMTHDRLYYFLPYWDDKPCMHLRAPWPDLRRRMYNSNMLAKIVETLEDGLSEVSSIESLSLSDGQPEAKLKTVLEDLCTASHRYVTLATSSGALGYTRLDKNRLKHCISTVENIGTMARNLKALVTKHSFKERYKTAQSYLQKLKLIVEDPQHALPDVFVWLVSNGKRTAYQRISARDIIYSPIEEECGRHCSKVHSLFLKLPGKKGVGAGGWIVPAKLQIFFWLGLVKHKKNFVNGLTKGYQISHEIKNADRPHAMPPSVIHYLEKYSFQVRAYMYQARSLIGSDASGLSDPFARVIVGEYCRTTQVIDETLSPTWDELLVFDEILVYGTKEEIKNEPPTIIIEIFDQDKVGKSEFIGRAVAKPHVKLLEEAYTKPDFPPSLEWFEIYRGQERAGELLATFEMLELVAGGELPDLPPAKTPPNIAAAHLQDETGPILPVPCGIRPTLANYRLEVLFWGLRDLKRVHLLTVDKPRVDIECAGHILHSSVILNAKKNPNFSTPVKYLELELPEQELYQPPLTIRTVDCRSFGRFTLVGTHMINSVLKYTYIPQTKKQREAEDKKIAQQQLNQAQDNMEHQIKPTSPILNGSIYARENEPLLPRDTTILISYGTQSSIKKDDKLELNKRKKRNSILINNDEDQESRDWWTKYFASVEALIQEGKDARKDQQLQLNNGSIPQAEMGSLNDKKGKISAKLAAKLSPKSGRPPRELNTSKLKIYTSELESQPEFEGFNEWLSSFELYRGKKTGDESEDESRIVGIFKGAIKIYRWPLPKDTVDHTVMGFDPQFGFFQGLPSNEPIHVLVRVYIVKATDLHPMDLNGKADPYIVLQLGTKRMADKENYISKQLNPVFGKCFEIEATFPQDSMLTVQVLDWDLVGADDLIGETKIDLENRFYSRHRATCGITSSYDVGGYNQWRDPMKPTQILARLCKEGKLDPPVYLADRVKVGGKTFCLQSDPEMAICGIRGSEEEMALGVLHNWQEVPRIGCHLVPEHVETRPLYNPDKPGIEQGKLEMWVDMFPMDMPAPGPPLDISPRKPKSYELRVIIWNTDEVVLEDDAFFTGEKMSDIYVKGWLKGQEDCQCTDIHYRSLTGEGNFNWRFVFPFQYLVAEQKIVISKKESLFSWDETESKIPARLELQVWDADHFSADDFLGAITLDLNTFPRGAKSAKLCTLDMLKTDGTVPVVNIFKAKRVKGWWPFYVKKENEEMELTGKVEAEIHLLTQEEAEKNPAGLGRNEPDPLDKPNRPDASFMWFLNPLKSIRYIVWHNYKWRILKFFIILAVMMMFFLFFYAIPGYSVKKIIGA
ncbi:otoferlin-like isoform X1 [Cimex lectularius]|uniref:C2 domain-containing protein n=1 Tax=Cimex lectularius TaxID=79782 RepID=A0A8I6SIY2_CIMLE|nr:otoferlin-like isoform X1 [Cimex lectularius]